MILSMNLKKLREIGFEDIFLKLISAVKFDVAQDQDYLNVICKGHVKFIDETWDQMPIPVDVPRPKVPALIHYNLSFKPWHVDNILYVEKHKKATATGSQQFAAKCTIAQCGFI